MKLYGYICIADGRSQYGTFVAVVSLPEAPTASAALTVFGGVLINGSAVDGLLLIVADDCSCTSGICNDCGEHNVWRSSINGLGRADEWPNILVSNWFVVWNWLDAISSPNGMFSGDGIVGRALLFGGDASVRRRMPTRRGALSLAGIAVGVSVLSVAFGTTGVITATAPDSSLTPTGALCCGVIAVNANCFELRSGRPLCCSDLVMKGRCVG